MKRLLLLLFAAVSMIHASAQEFYSSQDQSAAISIDSLSFRLNKLQHDYDFMYCDYQLTKLIMDLKDLSQSIGTSTNGVIINLYNGGYERALYNSYLNNYDSSCTLFDSLKEKIEVVRFSIMLKMASSDFTDKEISLLYSTFDVIQMASIAVDRALNYYDVAIKAYRDTR